MTVSVLLNRINTLRRPAPDAPVSLNRQLFQLAWPSLVENLLQTMLGVVDLIFVGKLGADAIAGVGLGSQIMFTLVVTIFGLSVGTTALVARAVGANRIAEAQRMTKQSLVIVALLSIAIAILGSLFGDAALTLMGAEAAVREIGSGFVRVTTTFAIFIGIMVVGSAALRGAGDTRTPMLVTGLVNIVNIVLDYGLIFGNLGLPRLGAVGSAYATTAARAVGSLLILYVLFRRGSILKLDWQRGWKPVKSSIARILNIGWPSALEQIIFQVGFLTYTAIVVGLGTADLAAMQVALNIASFSVLPALAISVAALTMVGQSLGARDIPRAEASTIQAAKSGIVWMSLMGVGFFLWRRELFGFYTQDPAVIALGEMLMIFIAIMQPLQAVAFVVSSALRGGGDTRAAMFITAFCVWFLRVAVGYLFGILLGLGLFGVWIGWCVDFVARSTLVVLRYRSGKWKYMRV